MTPKKSMCVLFGILVMSAWVLGSVILAGAETMKCKSIATVTKDETISVSDEEGHFLRLRIMEGLAFFENGEIAKVRLHVLSDAMKKGSQAIGYIIYTFDDGSTIVNRYQRLSVADQSGNFSHKTTSEIIKGTGRFEGIKGTTSSTGKDFPATKEEAGRAFNDSTLTYTLPTK